MGGKRLILILFFFLLAKVAFGQSISYTYVDPCTGIPNTVTVSSQSGTVVMFYAGNYQTFTMSQLQAGGYEAWVASVNAAAPPGSNPCAGNAGAVSGTTSASVGTNVTNTVSTVTGALATLGGTTTTSSGGLDVSGSTSTSSGSSSSSNSNDSGNDQGNGDSSGDDGGDSGSSSTSSGSSNDGSSGSSSGGSGSSDSGSGSSSGTGSSTDGGGSGDTGGSSSGSSGSTDGGGSSGGGSGGSTGGGSTSGGGTGGGSNEGGQGTSGGSVDSGGGDDSNSGGSIGEQDIESSSGGESESSSEEGGSGGGKKKKGPRARKGSLIASGDMVLVRNGSDYKASGMDNYKFNAGMTYANTNQTLAAGGLLNYTTGQNEFVLTGYGSWKVEESMIVGSNSFLYNIKQQTWFNTGNIMYAYKQTSYATILFGTNFSIGQLGEESFSNWSAQVGVFTTFNGWKGYSLNLMGIGMYSPFTFFYEGQWFKGGFLLVPLTSIDLSITNTFKLNISTSTVLLQGQGILNFQLMTGAKMLL